MSSGLQSGGAAFVGGMESIPEALEEAVPPPPQRAAPAPAPAPAPAQRAEPEPEPEQEPQPEPEPELQPELEAEPVEEQHDAGSHRHEGWLQTDGGVHGAKLKKFWFVLTADAQLVYYKDKDACVCRCPATARANCRSHASLAAHLSAPILGTFWGHSGDILGTVYAQR